MGFFKMDMPHFVKREVEHLHDIISPLMKKVSMYMLWSFPLIIVSIANLFLLLFIVPEYQSVSAMVVYCILGAVGLALSTEARLQRKKIFKVSIEYIVERIKQSEIVSDLRKKEYIDQIKGHPARALNHFIAFLEEENRADRIRHLNNTVSTQIKILPKNN